MNGRSALVALTEGMPELRLVPDEALFSEGDSGSEVAVLIDGALTVTLGDVVIDQHSTPGALVGEIGALVGGPRTATVSAATDATLRIIGDPEAFFATHPEVALELARQLARRVHRLLSYLADIREQYSDSAEHVTMVNSLITRLAMRPPMEIDGGSDRSPDY